MASPKNHVAYVRAVVDRHEQRRTKQMTMTDFETERASTLVSALLHIDPHQEPGWSDILRELWDRRELLDAAEDFRDAVIKAKADREELI
jgi:hypothetical protein